MSEIPIYAPTVHLNGTSGEELVRQLRTAWEALDAARDALAQAAPHGRDYYPQEAGAYERARRAHEARLEALRQILADVEQIHERVVEQIDQREARQR